MAGGSSRTAHGLCHDGNRGQSGPRHSGGHRRRAAGGNRSPSSSRRAAIGPPRTLDRNLHISTSSATFLRVCFFRTAIWWSLMAAPARLWLRSEMACRWTILPVAADQPDNARRCVDLGVTETVTTDERAPGTIRAATRKVLADARYQENAARLRDEIQAMPGPDHAVALLERLEAEQHIPAFASDPGIEP